ncbi:hypothetical protein HN51_039443 [Arachis hypogaea]
MVAKLRLVPRVNNMTESPTSSTNRSYFTFRVLDWTFWTPLILPPLPRSSIFSVLNSSLPQNRTPPSYPRLQEALNALTAVALTSTHSPPSRLQHGDAVTSVAPSAPWRRWVRRAFRYLAQSAPSRRQLRRVLSSVAPSATSHVTFVELCL